MVVSAVTVLFFVFVFVICFGGVARAVEPNAASSPLKASALDAARPSFAAALRTSYYSDVRAPATIRIARRQKCVDTGGSKTTFGFKSCPSSPGKHYPDACGKVLRVDVVPFDDYVKHVLPREWLVSWHPESLRSGAMAVKTYGWYWVNKGGKYPKSKDICGRPTVDLAGKSVSADLDDTVNSQMYISEVVPDKRINAAVDSVSQFRMTKGGKVFQASYRASTCGWKPDGYKLSQNGSQCWALKAKTWDWILRYYYSGVEVSGSSQVTIDNTDAGFTRSNPASVKWFKRDLGGIGHSFYYSSNTQTTPTRSGTWRSELGCPGNWKVQVFLPWAFSTTTNAKYSVLHNGVSSDVAVDQLAGRGKWRDLGAYHFPSTPAASVYLPSNTGETLDATTLSYDAVRFDRLKCDVTASVSAGPAVVTYRVKGKRSSNVVARIDSGALPLPRRTVSFYERRFGGPSWSYLGARVTNGFGNASLPVTPDKNTHYLVKMNGTSSLQAAKVRTKVLVRPRVGAKLSSATAMAGQNSLLSGRVLPVHKKIRVSHQLKRGTWVEQSQGFTDKKGRYAYSFVTQDAGVYLLRTCVDEHWDHQANCSGARRVTVK